MFISELWLKTGHADMIGSSASHRPALLRCPSVRPAVLTGPACNYSSSGDGHAALRATAQRQGCYRVSWPTTYWLPVAQTCSSAGATVSMTSSHGCLPWVTHRCLCCPFPSRARVYQWMHPFVLCPPGSCTDSPVPSYNRRLIHKRLRSLLIPCPF